MSGGRTVSEILADGGEPLLDRLHALTLPDPGDVADGLERYVEASERAEELEARIGRTDDPIDEIVYESYGLIDGKIRIVEEAVEG